MPEIIAKQSRFLRTLLSQNTFAREVYKFLDNLKEMTGLTEGEDYALIWRLRRGAPRQCELVDSKETCLCVLLAWSFFWARNETTCFESVEANQQSLLITAVVEEEEANELSEKGPARDDDSGEDSDGDADTCVAAAAPTQNKRRAEERAAQPPAKKLRRATFRFSRGSLLAAASA